MANAENPLLSLSSEKQQQIVDLVDNGNIDKIAEKGGMTRRQVLQVAVALGAGATAGGYSVDQIIGEARAAADTSDSDGNVGLPGDRVDLFAEGADISGTATAAQVGTSSDRFTGYADVFNTDSLVSVADVVVRPSDDIDNRFSSLSQGDTVFIGGDHTANSQLIDDTSPNDITVIAYGATITKDGTASKSNIINPVGQSNINVMGGSWDGNGGSTGQGVPIRFNAAKNSTLKDATVQGGYDGVVYVSNDANSNPSEDVHIQNCYIDISGVVNQAGAILGDSKDCSYKGCTIDGSSDRFAANLVYGATRGKYIGCTIRNTGTGSSSHGLHFEGGITRCLVDSCTIISSNQNAVNIVASVDASDSHIANCIIDAGANGIDCSGPITVSDLTIDAGTDGILAGAEIVAKNCEVQSAGGNAATFKSSPDARIIGGEYNGLVRIEESGTNISALLKGCTIRDASGNGVFVTVNNGTANVELDGLTLENLNTGGNSGRNGASIQMENSGGSLCRVVGCVEDSANSTDFLFLRQTCPTKATANDHQNGLSDPNTNLQSQAGNNPSL